MGEWEGKLVPKIDPPNRLGKWNFVKMSGETTETNKLVSFGQVGQSRRIGLGKWKALKMSGLKR